MDSTIIIADRFSGQSCGFGFVEMPNDQETETAVERVNGHQLGGRALTVNEAKPHGAHSGNGSRERGR